MRPYHKNGMHYGFGPDGQRICLGARMGRSNMLPENPEAPVRLSLAHVPFYDGVYDKGGAYWGSPANLWCAWNKTTQVFTRARGREEAIRLIRDLVPGAVFNNQKKGKEI
jgi:hypothetical protein